MNGFGFLEAIDDLAGLLVDRSVTVAEALKSFPTSTVDNPRAGSGMFDDGTVMGISGHLVMVDSSPFGSDIALPAPSEIAVFFASAAPIEFHDDIIVFGLESPNFGSEVLSSDPQDYPDLSDDALAAFLDSLTPADGPPDYSDLPKDWTQPEVPGPQTPSLVDLGVQPESEPHSGFHTGDQQSWLASFHADCDSLI